MSNYIFAPNPPTEDENNPYVHWTNGFTPEELDKLEAYCDTLTVEKATISGYDKGVDYSTIRESKTGWISENPDISWFYGKMAYIARSLNAKYYRFDLYGFLEDFQYTVYVGGDNGHYNWHIDAGSTTTTPRKLSLVLQLTDPEEYEGGELQLMASGEISTVKKERGFVAAFPSYVLHRVTPVTKGVRKTIVVWTTGPAFR